MRTAIFYSGVGLFIAVGLTPAEALAAPIPGDHNCLGRWVGTGQNTGYDTAWTIELTLTSAPSGGRCGTIEYTNPACGGFLDACQLQGGEIHTRENYTHRSSDCAPPGNVIIVCNGDTMNYAWIGWERVDSVLRRSGQPTPVDGPSSDAPMQPSVAPTEASEAAPAPEVPSGEADHSRGSAQASTEDAEGSSSSGVLDLCPLTGFLWAVPLPLLFFRRGSTNAAR